MDEAFIRRLFEIIARKTAAKVGGTEAYAAAVIDIERAVPELRRLAHIRPGDASTEEMALARKAFEDLISPCLAQEKDGAILVSRHPDKGNQYGLIHLLRDNSGRITAVIAIIAHCNDDADARQRLWVIANSL